jgi:hypothetical protein
MFILKSLGLLAILLVAWRWLPTLIGHALVFVVFIFFTVVDSVERVIRRIKKDFTRNRL